MTAREVRLNEVASVVRGVSFDKAEVIAQPAAGYLPILRAGNIHAELLIDRDLVWVPEARVASEQRLQVGDIAICMSSGSQTVVGKTASLRKPWLGSVGAFCALVRPLSDKVNPEYLGYFLQSDRFRSWTRQSSGANIKNIRKSELEAFGVSLPPLEVQHRVVDLLSRAEGIVRLRREAQTKAAEIIPALFVDMFGDTLKNPLGFDRLKLETVAEIVSGITKGRKLNGRKARPVPYLRVANVQAGFLDLTELKHIDATESEIQAWTLQPGDIVLTEGGDFDKLGRGAQWRERIPDCIHQNHVFRVRLNRDMAEPSYLEAFLQTPAAKSYFLSVAKRTTNLASINMTQLRSLPVLLPPIELQRVFLQRVDAIRSVVDLQRSARVNAEAAFNALLARFFDVRRSEGVGPVGG